MSPAATSPTPPSSALFIGYESSRTDEDCFGWVLLSLGIPGSLHQSFVAVGCFSPLEGAGTEASSFLLLAGVARSLLDVQPSSTTWFEWHGLSDRDDCALSVLKRWRHLTISLPGVSTVGKLGSVCFTSWSRFSLTYGRVAYGSVVAPSQEANLVGRALIPWSG
jgi:hypothetical protein